ncbi:uncharacterized protein BO72DRAFT_70511 [Aspergillus fijiensis CBS 313.89]|uniref:Uncharacterized protein n=1 Tax=Aspergillus fijiensis CBS 313.89 TaxID=1448319 RepID=A0A8G1RSN7_9EURO|nr:uncharacterized protein BO72DRAFT_70511 [Aspergillus fijiensis CBS 313.89]RAK78755.1 hypothetical protein BO72DRAFT_70511 [Aspergillus fijiensis CBS 313.89]
MKSDMINAGLMLCSTPNVRAGSTEGRSGPLFPRLSGYVLVMRVLNDSRCFLLFRPFIPLPLLETPDSIQMRHGGEGFPPIRSSDVILLRLVGDRQSKVRGQTDQRRVAGGITARASGPLSALAATQRKASSVGWCGVQLSLSRVIPACT